MSELRVHNLSISLDGFATGAGQAPDAPFGHAGERLHEWMFATRFWYEMGGGRGGSAGADNAFAERHPRRPAAVRLDVPPHGAVRRPGAPVARRADLRSAPVRVEVEGQP